MQLSFDVRLVALLSALMPLVLGVLTLIYWLSRKTYPGFGFWVLSNFSIALGSALILFRFSIPDFFSIVVGNALTIYGLILIYHGLRLFFNHRAFDLPNPIVLALVILSLLYFTFIQYNTNMRILLVSAAALFLEMRIGAALIRRAPPALRQSCRSIAVIFFVSALFSLLRGVQAAFQSQPIDMLADDTMAALSIGLICTITVWTFYFFFLTSNRLELDLQDARRSLLATADTNQRQVVQLGLLDETSRSLAESIRETEIMQIAVTAVVNRFGYAEAAISRLVDGDTLEVVAIDGTEDIGFKPGFRQKLGEGIIGHAAANRAVHLSGDIENDPYYFSIGKRSGSAVGVPMLDDGQVLGVLYVESTTRNAFTRDDIQTLDTLVRHAVTAIQKARLYARTEAHLLAMSTLQSVSQTILSSLELQDVFQSVVQLLKDTFKYTYVSIYRLDGRLLRLEAQAGYPEESIIAIIPAEAGISGRCVLTKQTQFIQDVSSDPAFLRAAYDIESEICIPILKGEQVLAILNVEAAPGQPLTQDDVAVLTTLVGPVVIAMDNAQLHYRVTQLALTDALTHLNNRRAFDQTLEKELDRAARYNYAMSLIIIDMDSFKEFNDRFGHPAGDEQLKAVADLLRTGLRNPDFVARYGGEEFALILPNTQKSTALVLAERLRRAAEARAPEKMDHGAPIAGYTFSMGVATYPDDGRTVESLLIAADQAEMLAKRLGKNRISAAGSGLSVTTFEKP